MTEKKRLDVLMFEKGLAESREKAQRIIMSGNVYIKGQKAEKAGMNVPIDCEIEVRGGQMPFVSRGGYKLDKAVHSFDLNLKGLICMDIGASTGGFTDCMLQNGASKVYAVDVGYGQLAWKLRTDPRVVNLERTNIRYITEEQAPELLDFASIDVSFISLGLVLPVLYRLLKEDGEAVCLIKPQFEAGKGKVGKKGVVRDPAVHCEVIETVLGFTAETGFAVLHLDFSPVRGPEGNIEYLMHVQKSDKENCFTVEEVKQLVDLSHQTLSGGATKA
ncbi:MAG: TlyA family RNA methyltransferase [Clostridiales bacterium]|nr:TlyA family RNA methyltransferase [Clostridiales bacterium]